MSDRYLIDSVTLSKMSTQECRSDFVRAQCRVPSEIMYEARGHKTEAMLKPIEYETTTDVLLCLKEVLADLKVEDRLIDLYRNQGNGDLMILAVALMELRVGQTQLFPDRWIIATDDKGVSAMAAHLKIETCDSTELKRLITKSTVEFTAANTDET